MGNTSGIHAFSYIDKLSMPDINSTGKYLSSIGISPDKINLAAFSDISNLVNSSNPSAAMAKVKGQLIGGGQLSPADAQAINQAGSDPKALMAALVQGLNDTGLQQDDSTKYQQATADLTNALTAAGTGLIPVVTGLKSVMSDMLSPLGIISKDLDQMLGNNHSGGGFFDVTGNGGGMQYVSSANPGGATRGQRNNNPFNVGYASGQLGAYGEDGGGFGVYKSVSEGIAGALANIKYYQAHGIRTLAATDERWTPSSQNASERDSLESFEQSSGLTDSSDMRNPANLLKYLLWKATIESRMNLDSSTVQKAIQVAINPLTVTVQHPNGTSTKHILKTTATPVNSYNSGNTAPPPQTDNPYSP